MSISARDVKPGDLVEDDSGELHKIADIEEVHQQDGLDDGKLIIHDGDDLCIIVDPDYQLNLPGIPRTMPRIEQPPKRRSRPRVKAETQSSPRTASTNGKDGERFAEGLLHYEGWAIIERQALVHGHVIDLRVKHPQYGEALVEVKVWGSGGGKDTVKKALSDAYDLRECGETTPYILVLSHHLTGQYRDQLLRAQRAGVIKEIRVLGFMPLAS